MPYTPLQNGPPATWSRRTPGSPRSARSDSPTEHSVERGAPPRTWRPQPDPRDTACTRCARPDAVSQAPRKPPVASGSVAAEDSLRTLPCRLPDGSSGNPLSTSVARSDAGRECHLRDFPKPQGRRPPWRQDRSQCQPNRLAFVPSDRCGQSIGLILECGALRTLGGSGLCAQPQHPSAFGGASRRRRGEGRNLELQSSEVTPMLLGLGDRPREQPGRRHRDSQGQHNGASGDALRGLNLVGRRHRRRWRPRCAAASRRAAPGTFPSCRCTTPRTARRPGRTAPARCPRWRRSSPAAASCSRSRA